MYSGENFRNCPRFLEPKYSGDASDALLVFAHLEVFKANIASELAAMGLKEGDRAKLLEKSAKKSKNINERNKKEERYKLELLEALRHIEGVIESVSIGATFTAVKCTIALLNNYYISNSVIGSKSRAKGREVKPIGHCRCAREMKSFREFQAKNSDMSNNDIYIEICKKQGEEWRPKKYDKIRQRIKTHKEDFNKMKYLCGITSGTCDFHCLDREVDNS